jgi:Protein of unknown function (DUF2911)
MLRRSILLVLAVALGAAALWFSLTSFAPGPWVAVWAPCPRNWGWTPAWLPRPSPLGSLAFRLGEGHLKLCYGRPSLRGRTMLGGDAVPWGRLWRTGANEPTTIHSDRPFRIGELALDAGSYSLYSVPDPQRWQIVVNGSIRQWGLEPIYPSVAAAEIARFPVAAERTAAPVETLTFRVGPQVGSARELILEWQESRVRIPLSAR